MIKAKLDGRLCSSTLPDLTPSMAKRIPTQLGDVLILQTTQSCTIYAMGRVSKDGQQDFGSEKDVKHEVDYRAADARAKTLVVHGRRVFIRNIEGDDWSEL